MAAGGGGGKGKSHKHGRNSRRPGHARRLARRPDLRRKVRNVARHGGDVRAWADAAVKRGNSILVVGPIRDAELKRQAARA